MARPLPVNLLLAGGGAILLVSGIGGKSLASVIKGDFGNLKTNPEAGKAKSAAFYGEGLEGSTFGASPVAFGNGEVARPFAGGTRTSIDQGVDYSLTPGEAIRAIGSGVVKGIEPNWYAGQPFLWYEVTSGPLRGKNYYIAEQIVPTVSPGQRVQAGQTIARYAQQGTGLEIGEALPSGETVARSEGWTEAMRGSLSGAGDRMLKLIESLKETATYKPSRNPNISGFV